MSGMITHNDLKSHYAGQNRTIRQRLREFAEKKSLDELFVELCFCICTPQSKAVKVAEVIHAGNLDTLRKSGHEKLAKLLQRNTRFHNNKAKHIIAARKYYAELDRLPKGTVLAREFLVRNIKGLGYKESSHFLRNIGYRNLCIVDRHVIGIMHELGVFENDKVPSTPKKYLEMETRIKKYASKHGYDVDELDLALWSFRTGHVFK